MTPVKTLARNISIAVDSVIQAKMGLKNPEDIEKLSVLEQILKRAEMAARDLAEKIQ